VAFAHPRNSDLRDFYRFYGCSVEFGRAAHEAVSSDLIEFSNDALVSPLVTGDTKLLDALRPFCDIAAKERNTRAGTLRAAVENEVEKLLPQGKAQAHTVAKALALSVRTPARRLADEGVTYGEVVDQLRRTLALQYLKEPGMSLSQIDWLLGYEGSTSFNHAFRRWTGRSPSAVRNEKRATVTTLSSDAKCNTPRRFDIGKVVQDLKECCHAILFASLGRRKRPNRHFARRRAVDGSHCPGARSGKNHHLQGAAAERSPLGRIFAASRRRSLSIAQAA
jgi:AraC-like DNA-binding protein